MRNTLRVRFARGINFILSRLRFPTTEEIELYALEVMDSPEDPQTKKIVNYAINWRRLSRFAGMLHTFIFAFFLGDVISLIIRKPHPLWMLFADLAMSISSGWLFFAVFRVDQKFRKVGL